MARGPGRPTKFTEDRIERYLQAANLGLPPKLCRAHAGWGRSTALDYLARGQHAQERAATGARLTPTETRFADFSEAVEKAEAAFALGNMAIVLQAARNGTWQAAAWGLERRWPEMFGRRWVDTGPGDEDEEPVEATADSLLDQLVELRAAAERPHLRALPPVATNGDEANDS